MKSLSAPPSQPHYPPTPPLSRPHTHRLHLQTQNPHQILQKHSPNPHFERSEKSLSTLPSQPHFPPTSPTLHPHTHCFRLPTQNPHQILPKHSPNPISSAARNLSALRRHSHTIPLRLKPRVLIHTTSTSKRKTRTKSCKNIPLTPISSAARNLPVFCRQIRSSPPRASSPSHPVPRRITAAL